MFHAESDRFFKIGQVHKWHRKETIRRCVKTFKWHKRNRAHCGKLHVSCNIVSIVFIVLF